MLVETTVQMAPAQVVACEGTSYLLDAPWGRVYAQAAIGPFYRPVLGDVIVALGQGEQCYIVGVLHGTGDVVIESPRNMTVMAPNGSIDLFAAKGLRAYSPEITLRATRLELVARSVFERFGSAYRWVKDCFQVRTGRLRVVSKGSYQLRAQRIVELAEKDVKIDGQRVGLG